jgi:hypothetical protein
MARRAFTGEGTIPRDHGQTPRRRWIDDPWTAGFRPTPEMLIRRFDEADNLRR